MSKKIDNRTIQMFDVRPIGADGFFDKKKIEKLETVIDLRKRKAPKKISLKIEDQDLFEIIPNIITDTNFSESFSETNNFPEEDFKKNDFSKEDILQELDYPIKEDVFSQKKKRQAFNFFPFFKKLSFSLAIIVVAFFFISGIFYALKGADFKAFLMQDGKLAYTNLAQAKESILNKDFSGSYTQFQSAYDDFEKISKEINFVGGFLAEAMRHLPFLSKISSGKYLAETGKNISQIGILSTNVMAELDKLKNPFEEGAGEISLLKTFQNINQDVKEISILLEETEKNIEKIKIKDIPEEQRLTFIEFKEQLPQIKNLAKAISDNNYIIEDILGGNGPRKYLFLFQNNQEMRATGGFIGTYGILDIFNGHIKKFFIDGIFNPDGQLKEKVVPPFPIQKISAAWSLHDSNWFPDFPVSAEKATWFYEKTGGPTVDGVITMTPTVMEKLLEVTGPIEMSEYDITVDRDNFLQIVQKEVEVDYDKDLNQPKKILADLAPIILDKIFNVSSLSDLSKVVNILQENLKEKQILIYSKNYNIEKKLSELGWSGEVLKTEKDYLSVINSNVNGFKTDGVIDEKIELDSEIQEDGSILNEVTITRKHNGGKTDYDWWNKVNSNYMRVYVPKGSQLISATGHTREFNSPPLDYKALNFKRDPQVEKEEIDIIIDPENGTRIYEDAGKTVFANWTYVSPQETVVVKYKYLLPFKLEVEEEENKIGTYSLVAQKQSGSSGSEFIATINFPSYYKSIWEFPEEINKKSDKIILKTNLTKDQYIGVAFSK